MKHFEQANALPKAFRTQIWINRCLSDACTLAIAIHNRNAMMFGAINQINDRNKHRIYKYLFKTNTLLIMLHYIKKNYINIVSIKYITLHQMFQRMQYVCHCNKKLFYFIDITSSYVCVG